MIRVRRRDMKPGQVFGIVDPERPRDRDALVVVDATTEVSFWSGLRYHVGHVMPSVVFEVMS